MYLLGNILAVHLIQDVLERRNVVVVPHGVDTVIPVSYTHLGGGTARTVD